MSKELTELIKELGKIVDGNQSIVEEMDKLKLLYEKLKLETAEEFDCPFRENESYWFVNSKGEVERTWWFKDDFDTARYEMGNAFSTEEATQKERDKRILLTRFRQFRDKCNGEWEPDFDKDSFKYYLSLNHITDVWRIHFSCNLEDFNLFGCFRKESDAARAIELFGDEIKRLWVEK